MAGLHREVYVEARSPVNLASLVCDAGLDGTTGTLSVTTKLGGLRPPDKGWAVRVGVENLRGTRVGASR